MGSFVAQNTMAITPNDSAALPHPVMRITIGGAGTIKLQAAHDAAPTTITVVAGQELELKVVQVWATGTTATGITGYW